MHPSCILYPHCIPAPTKALVMLPRFWELRVEATTLFICCSGAATGGGRAGVAGPPNRKPSVYAVPQSTKEEAKTPLVRGESNPWPPEYAAGNPNH